MLLAMPRSSTALLLTALAAIQIVSARKSVYLDRVIYSSDVARTRGARCLDGSPAGYYTFGASQGQLTGCSISRAGVSAYQSSTASKGCARDLGRQNCGRTRKSREATFSMTVPITRPFLGLTTYFCAIAQATHGRAIKSNILGLWGCPSGRASEHCRRSGAYF